MSSKAIVPLAIGLTVGIIAVSRGLNYIKSVKGANRAFQTVSVVTARAEIPQGVSLCQEMLEVKKVPKELAPERHFTEPNEILERVSAMIIPKDMPVLTTMLAPKGTSPGLGAKIPDGMRAVAVRVDEWSAVGGWIKPGVRVDVAAVLSVREGRESKTISKIILQNIEVAAVGSTMGQNPQDTGATVSRSVTLIVKPDDVAKLHLASSKGKIQLAMRNSLDEESKEISIHDEDELLHGKKKPAASFASALTSLFRNTFGKEQTQQIQVAEAPKRCIVDLINGPSRRRMVFQDKDSMEVMGSEGTVQALSQNQPRPYGQVTHRPNSYSSSSGSNSTDVEATESARIGE